MDALSLRCSSVSGPDAGAGVERKLSRGSSSSSDDVRGISVDERASAPPRSPAVHSAAAMTNGVKRYRPSIISADPGTPQGSTPVFSPARFSVTGSILHSPEAAERFAPAPPSQILRPSGKLPLLSQLGERFVYLSPRPSVSGKATPSTRVDDSAKAQEGKTKQAAKDGFLVPPSSPGRGSGGDTTRNAPVTPGSLSSSSRNSSPRLRKTPGDELGCEYSATYGGHAGLGNGANSPAPSSPRSSTTTKQQQVPKSAAEQQTPFGLNRYLLLIVHILYVFASARVLFGWPNLSNMLFRSGAFSWLCGEDSNAIPNTPKPSGGGTPTRYLCRAQDNAVQLLFTVGIAASFCFSLFAGMLMDWRGPRLCAAVGQIFNTIGWIFLALASTRFQVYIPAVLCLALGADAGYLPSITISNLFPGHEALVVVILSAAMSASFAIPTLMDISWQNNPEFLSFSTVCFFYAGMGTGLCCLVAFLLFPCRPYASQEELDRNSTFQQQKSWANAEDTAAAPTKPVYEDNRGGGSPGAARVSSSTSAGTWAKNFEEEEGEEDQQLMASALKLVAECCTDEEGKTWASGGKDIQKGETEGSSSDPRVNTSCSHSQEGSCVLKVKVVAEATPEGTDTQRSEYIPFCRQLRSPYFYCFFIYWPLNALFYNFYVTSVENMFSRELNDLLGILGPVSMIPSVLLGKLSDVYGTMSLVLFISCSGVCMYFFAVLPTVWAPTVSAVFSCLYVSNFSGQMYAYMHDTFLSSDFGKVVGITSAAGGLLALLRIPLHDNLTVNVLHGDYRRACGLMLGITLCCLLLALRLFFLKRKESKAYYADPCRRSVCRDVKFTDTPVAAQAAACPSAAGVAMTGDGDGKQAAAEKRKKKKKLEEDRIFAKLWYILLLAGSWKRRDMQVV